jgi:molybdenum-dependent DNA-binding transcriptional regulator ModE
MRLRHIEVFHAIMQVGTISGAAQVLHISQPAVTKVLQHCELQLGMPLFERVRGKLYPKPEAHRLFAETEKLHRDLQGIRRLAASLKGRITVETIRLVATPTDRRQRAAAGDARLAAGVCRHPLRAGDAPHQRDRQYPAGWARPTWACRCRIHAIRAFIAEPIAQGVMTVIAPPGTLVGGDDAGDAVVGHGP